MFKETAEGVEISLYIQPNASKTEVIGEYNGLLKIKIKSPPVDGKANEEIIRFLSQILQISKSRIEILKGDRSREKKLRVQSLSLAQIRTALTSQGLK